VPSDLLKNGRVVLNWRLGVAADIIYFSGSSSAELELPKLPENSAELELPKLPG
jgi:hypothetical protein